MKIQNIKKYLTETNDRRVGQTYSVTYDSCKFATNDRYWHTKDVKKGEILALISETGLDESRGVTDPIQNKIQFIPDKFYTNDNSEDYNDNRIILVKLDENIEHEDEETRKKAHERFLKRVEHTQIGKNEADHQVTTYRCQVIGELKDSDEGLMIDGEVSAVASSRDYGVYQIQNSKMFGSIVNNVVRTERLNDPSKDNNKVQFCNVCTSFKQEVEDKIGVPVKDVVGRNVGVLGSTRNGKSNLIKLLVSSVENSDLRTSQMVFDIKGDFRDLEGMNGVEIINSNDIGIDIVSSTDSVVEFVLSRMRESGNTNRNYYRDLSSFNGDAYLRSDGTSKVSPHGAYILKFLAEKGIVSSNRVIEVKISQIGGVWRKVRLSDWIKEWDENEYGSDKESFEEAFNEYGYVEENPSKSYEHFKKISGSLDGGSHYENLSHIHVDNPDFSLARNNIENGISNFSGTRIIDGSDSNETDLGFKTVYLLRNLLDSREKEDSVRGSRDDFVQVYLDEAHRYYGKRSNVPSKKYFIRIAKEGNGDGIGVTYSTQEIGSISSEVKQNTRTWFLFSTKNYGADSSDLSMLRNHLNIQGNEKSYDIGECTVLSDSYPFSIRANIHLFEHSDSMNDGEKKRTDEFVDIKKSSNFDPSEDTKRSLDSIDVERDTRISDVSYWILKSVLKKIAGDLKSPRSFTISYLTGSAILTLSTFIIGFYIGLDPISNLIFNSESEGVGAVPVFNIDTYLDAFRFTLESNSQGDTVIEYSGLKRSTILSHITAFVVGSTVVRIKGYMSESREFYSVTGESLMGLDPKSDDWYVQLKSYATYALALLVVLPVVASIIDWMYPISDILWVLVAVSLLIMMAFPLIIVVAHLFDRLSVVKEYIPGFGTDSDSISINVESRILTDKLIINLREEISSTDELTLFVNEEEREFKLVNDNCLSVPIPDSYEFENEIKITLRHNDSSDTQIVKPTYIGSGDIGEALSLEGSAD